MSPPRLPQEDSVDSVDSTRSSSTSSASSSINLTYSRDNSSPPRVEILRCSRCAMSVEIITRSRAGPGRSPSIDDAAANGMVRFGTNLYYCDRCAKMVGYT